ncbi:MAG: hypothetical protein AABX48_00850, partial [Nanoarchaeota archaeon]
MKEYNETYKTFYAPSKDGSGETTAYSENSKDRERILGNQETALKDLNMLEAGTSKRNRLTLDRTIMPKNELT